MTDMLKEIEDKGFEAMFNVLDRYIVFGREDGYRVIYDAKKDDVVRTYRRGNFNGESRPD